MLNICALEDPSNPKTWSATPYNLIQEFSKAGVFENSFPTDYFGNRLTRKLRHIANQLLYHPDDPHGHGRINRFFTSRVAAKQTESSVSKRTLHCGTLDLPFLRKPSNQRHYLYCDYTWHLFALSMAERLHLGPRILKDAERLEKKAYQQLDHIFTISEYVREDFISHYGISPQKVTRVGSGRGNFAPYFGEKDFSNGKILFVAKDRFDQKGGPLVLDAFRLAYEENQDLHLTIVGQDEYLEKIEHPGVSTFGFLPLEELEKLYHQASLFVMAAQNEPWGLVYLESLLCRIPIVGLNRNAFPEISNHGEFGFCLTDDRPETLKTTILDAFQDPHRLEQMGENGQKNCIENYSWARTAECILRRIKDIES